MLSVNQINSFGWVIEKMFSFLVPKINIPFTTKPKFRSYSVTIRFSKSLLN